MPGSILSALTKLTHFDSMWASDEVSTLQHVSCLVHLQRLVLACYTVW